MVGRSVEIALLNRIETNEASAFVAVYGRRRVGKTYLIRTVFENKLNFQLTGIANVDRIQQLANFNAAYFRQFPNMEGKVTAKTWFDAFQLLIDGLEALNCGKKIIFLDELPWLDAPQSGFISALEHFWNSWASARKDVILIVCGSAAYWITHNLINNRGGLHNRVTHQIKLEPFTLGECEIFFKQKSAVFDRYQLIQLYMALGGIPFYLDRVESNKSATQNINDLCFKTTGALRNEFDNLYTSLFKKAEKHVAIIETLAQKSKGMKRAELLNMAKLPTGGSSTKILKELEESGFIRKYQSFEKREKSTIYQLSDFYSLFYLRFMKKSNLSDKNSWINRIDSPEIRAWSGYAYEMVCLSHLDQIKQALGIQGVLTNSSVWHGNDSGRKAQIDLLIDRRDHVINLCEIKFSNDVFIIDKSYSMALREKMELFRSISHTKKSIFLTMITTFGLTQNEYAASIVQNQLTMDVLFLPAL